MFQWKFPFIFFSFWSSVLFNKTFLDPLAHFLQESTPFYIPITQIFPNKPELIETYTKLCRNALVIVCRLITNRESDTEFMTKEKQTEILYDNFVVSMPLIFDLIALYGYANKDLMQKFLDTLVKIEPRYIGDLKAGMKVIESTFQTLSDQLVKIDEENREKFVKFEDLSLYLMNVAATLSILIEILPSEVKLFCSRGDLHMEAAIANFYENFVIQLYKNSHSVDPAGWFLQLINYARVELITAFRNFVNRPIMAIFTASEKNRHKIGDEILSVFSECAGFPAFIADYVKVFPVEMDLEVLMQCDGKKM